MTTPQASAARTKPISPSCQGKPPFWVSTALIPATSAAGLGVDWSATVSPPSGTVDGVVSTTGSAETDGEATGVGVGLSNGTGVITRVLGLGLVSSVGEGLGEMLGDGDGGVGLTVGLLFAWPGVPWTAAAGVCALAAAASPRQAETARRAAEAPSARVRPRLLRVRRGLICSSLAEEGAV